MKFLIHYIVIGSVKNLHCDFVTEKPISAGAIEDLRTCCLEDFNTQVKHMQRGRKVLRRDIVIGGIFPIPDGEPARTKEIGGS